METFENLFSTETLEALYKHNISAKASKGIDRVSPYAFYRDHKTIISNISKKVLTGRYTFTPYLEHLYTKGRSQCPRLISVPTIRDKITLTALNIYLQSKFPNFVNRIIPNQRIRKIHKALTQYSGETSLQIGRTDIENFYASIDRKMLLDKIEKAIHPLAQNLLLSAINNPTVPKWHSRSDRQLYTTTSGIPQGIPISSILAEIYISDVDSTLKEETLFFDRYVDDIIFISDNWKASQHSLEECLSKLQLSVNRDKTTSGLPSQCFNYLGYSICNGSILIKKSSFERQIRIINNLFISYKKDRYIASRKPDSKKFETITDNFIEDLNIRLAGSYHDNKRYGCVFYYSEITDTSQLYQIDAFVSKQLKKTPHISPSRIKSAARAFHNIKAGNSESYSHKFNHLTPLDMIEYLTKRGAVDTETPLTPFEIQQKYFRYINKRLKGLEEDMGIVY
ncbi:RNA-directed DNA polymerase [Nitratidesulfovibrio vulgaris]|uniref:RNA-directed DNA polymerase n=1 Tax=Nitratidesulfovibrio vulgaris TaxID=881 RepID=UPI0023010D24|nr:RNA-directed DNA polymerase [Nitratidesulfovibrio vulgaris]WCB46403.1 reverse transcriptase domain-containing protein [Nitratidesulfovibrio vulgaris]